MKRCGKRISSGRNWLLGLLLLQGTLGAQAEAVEDRLRAILADIESGWEQADGQPFRDHFLDYEGARYIEGGGQNEGLDDLIEHHVKPEGDAFDEFDLSFSNIEIHLEGDSAWAITDVELTAVLKSSGERIHRRGYGTYLFRRLEDGWKVVHTHSSSRPMRPDE